MNNICENENKLYASLGNMDNPQDMYGQNIKYIKISNDICLKNNDINLEHVKVKQSNLS